MSRPTFITWSTHPSWEAEEPYWFLGHWVKGQGQQGPMCQNCFWLFNNNFPKWISSSYICGTYFEVTNPVVQNICDKKLHLTLVPPKGCHRTLGTLSRVTSLSHLDTMENQLAEINNCRSWFIKAYCRPKKGLLLLFTVLMLRDRLVSL